MKTKEIIGIDVSKLTIDVCIHTTKFQENFENNPKGLEKMLLWVFKKSSFQKKEVLFVFEHTGLYSERLTTFFESKKVFYTIVPGLEIQRSLGITRGKDDRVDAKRIALYGYRLREELKPSKDIGLQLKKLKSMASLRMKLVKQRAGFVTCLKEQKTVLKAKDYKIIFEVQESLINTLSKKIKKIENQITEIIKADKELKKVFDLIISIKGVGAVTAIAVIIHTAKFTKFDNWRKFASYSGIAPFPYQSGTSIKARSKVSHLANKELKKLLNMCALSAIGCNPEMRIYYQKRIEKGKHKMSTLNIIRNKLVSRIFAVVNRGTEYIDTLKYAS